MMVDSFPSRDSPGADRYAWTALRNAVARIASARVNARHLTCLREARSLARLVEAGLLTRADVERGMAEALFLAGKSREEGEDIALWALAHPSSAPLKVGIV